MKTRTNRLQHSLRIFSRRAFPTIMVICLLAVTAVPVGARSQQTIPSRYELSFVAEPTNGTVTIQQNVDFTARHQVTRIWQADHSLHQFDFAYNEQGATVLISIQRRPVLSVSFPASQTADPQVTWLNGTTPDSLHQALFLDVQLLSQMREDNLSLIGLPIEAAYLSAIENTDAIYGSAPDRFIRTPINPAPHFALAVDPLVTFCAVYGASVFKNCIKGGGRSQECAEIGVYAFSRCIRDLG